MSDKKLVEELKNRLETVEADIKRIKVTGKYFYVGDALNHKQNALRTLIDFLDTPVII